ncbi:hypothetical protein WAE56_14575 [Iodobacter sp. LRB]|uniref:hypothetical protein n=1 Tax=Iodobacter sp. LRB TaxID=3127955 RepID=UPI00307EDA7A
MPASTPIASTKSAALSRVIDSIPKGYHKYTAGTVAPEKAERMIRRLHQRHAIGATPAQRITRKQHKRANAILCTYSPAASGVVHWLMLFTEGELDSAELLRDVTDKSRLNWLGYELVRHPTRGATSWTWRRPKTEMAEHYTLLRDSLGKHHYGVVADHLQRIANQPGFHGVREQSWLLCQFARKYGYAGELPYLFYLQKIGHGDKLLLPDQI